MVGDIPSTRLSLLARIRDSGEANAWDEFVRLYAPVVYRFSRRRGLQDSDAADVTQEVMQSLLTAIDRFEAEGRSERFRSWLLTIAHRRVYDFLARRRRIPPASGDSCVHQQLHETPAEESAEWDREWQTNLFALAAEEVRRQVAEVTWNAFWLSAVDGLSGKDVADRLGIRVASVFMAKSRVLSKLKDWIAAHRDD